jgi:CRISPR system Cascade subunit CasB
VTQPKQQSSKPEDIVFGWWSTLKDRKGDRAELRRARSPQDLLLTPAFHNLNRRLASSDWRSPERIALVAGVLAQVDESDPSAAVPEQFALPPSGGSKARLSGLRFRRLLQNQTPGDAFIPMMRAVRLLNRRVNVYDLANSLYFWGDHVRRRWAFSYYSKAPNEE